MSQKRLARKHAQSIVPATPGVPLIRSTPNLDWQLVRLKGTIDVEEGLTPETVKKKVYWGFNADSDRLPDLTNFRIAIENSFERLAAAAGVSLEVPPKIVGRTAALDVDVMPTAVSDSLGVQMPREFHQPGMPHAV